MNIGYASSNAQVVHRVMLKTERFITQVVASQIKGDDLKERCQRHLIAPGIPEVWEAMNHGKPQNRQASK